MRVGTDAETKKHTGGEKGKITKHHYFKIFIIVISIYSIYLIKNRLSNELEILCK